jgi:tRNA (adenine57-N1/adenine58-N1)-methyltransferase
MRLNVGPGSVVVEAGSGSGGLTTALAWFVGPTGKVYTHERREEFRKLNQKNLARVGLDDGRVEHLDRDIGDGFGSPPGAADALFLDVRTPWEYLRYVPEAVKPGAPIGFLLPTVGQVSDLLATLEQGPFAELEVMELMLRRWKPVAERLRPDDRMVAHTGFLVFARVIAEKEEIKAAPSDETQQPEVSEGGNEQEETSGSDGEGETS